jgi:hypothetical protein
MRIILGSTIKNQLKFVRKISVTDLKREYLKIYKQANKKKILIYKNYTKNTPTTDLDKDLQNIL